MILHTIVPYEKIFETNDIPPTEYVNIRGGFAQLDTTGGKRRITRIISTDPSVYLDSTLAPGSDYSPAGRESHFQS